MINLLKCLPELGWPKILFVLVIALALMGAFPFLKGIFGKAEAELGNPSLNLPGIVTVQENSLASVSNPLADPEVKTRIMAVITAYSSTPEETDDTPFITAAGTEVRDGIIANNLYPFGTKLRIPELFPGKIFVVEDRMNTRWGNYKFDIWFADTGKAKNFGVQTTYIEILEN